MIDVLFPRNRWVSLVNGMPSKLFFPVPVYPFLGGEFSY